MLGVLLAGCGGGSTTTQSATAVSAVTTPGAREVRTGLTLTSTGIEPQLVRTKAGAITVVSVVSRVQRARRLLVTVDGGVRLTVPALSRRIWRVPPLRAGTYEIVLDGRLADGPAAVIRATP